MSDQRVVLFVRSRSYRGAQRPVLYGLLALFSIGASPATAPPRAGWKPITRCAGTRAQQRRGQEGLPRRRRCCAEEGVRPLRGDPTRFGLVQQLDSIAG